MKLILGTTLTRFKKHDIPPENHPYYISLNMNDPKIYRKAVEFSRKQLSKPTANWDKYLRLKDIIKENGFIMGDDPIILKKKSGKWVCYHGRHRISILLYLYGPSMKLRIKKHEKIFTVHGIFL
jgi:hypothetical protein